MLKDEIRRLDSVHGVRDMSAAYAKNVLFKFFAADDREVRGSAWNVTVHARRYNLTHRRSCWPLAPCAAAGAGGRDALASDRGRGASAAGKGGGAGARHRRARINVGKLACLWMRCPCIKRSRPYPVQLVERQKRRQKSR